jgi:hypothetical protein
MQITPQKYAIMKESLREGLGRPISGNRSAEKMAEK